MRHRVQLPVIALCSCQARRFSVGMVAENSSFARLNLSTLADQFVSGVVPCPVQGSLIWWGDPKPLRRPNLWTCIPNPVVLTTDQQVQSNSSIVSEDLKPSFASRFCNIEIHRTREKAFPYSS